MLIGQPYTSALFAEARDENNAKLTRKILNYLVGPYQAHLKSLSTEDIDITQIKPKFSASQLLLVAEKESAGELSSTMAKQVLADMFVHGTDPAEIIEREGLVQVSDESALQEIVGKVVEGNPQAVADFKSGNEKALGFFVGQIMKETKGQANPKTVNELLRATLEKS